AIVFIPMLVAGAVIAASLWFVLKRIIKLARRKGSRRRALNEVFEEFQRDHPQMELMRLRRFVDVESGRGDARPHLLIRGPVFPGLTSTPWHDPSQFEWVKELEAATDTIREEVLHVVQNRAGFSQYFYPGVGNESWQSLMFYKGGRRIEENCVRCPETARLIEQLPGGTVREAMVSLLEPKAIIKPHRDSGNQLLTCHLGLSIPSDCAIRVRDPADWLLVTPGLLGVALSVTYVVCLGEVIPGHLCVDLCEVIFGHLCVELCEVIFGHLCIGLG